MALATGFTEGNRLEVKPDRIGYILLKTFDDEDLAIIKAIAIEEAGITALSDRKQVITICDEYAVSGIQILREKILKGDFGSFERKLESDLNDRIKLLLNND